MIMYGAIIGELMRKMLILGYIFFMFGIVIFAEELMVDSGAAVIANISIVSFLDDHNYIRFNMSWQKVICHCDEVSITFNNEERCNPINDIEKFSLRANKFLIIPSMEIKAPADHLMNNCQYDIILEGDGSIGESQIFSYKVPECVENKCSCRHARDSPYQLDQVHLQYDNVYRIHWKKTSQEILTVNEIYYRKPHNNLTTIIPLTDIIQKNDSAEVSLTDLKEGVSYKITVGFDDKYNECTYFSSINITIPINRNDVYVGIAIFLPMMLTLFSSFFIMIFFPKVWNKLKNYMSCKGLNDIQQSSYLETPLTVNFTDMRVNEQYVPLEFEQNQFDDFELPKNKLILEKKLDDGAFGTVFSGKAYGIRGLPNYTMVAVKQMKVGAGDDKLPDFMNEIEIMKKIGEHENIVKLMGCVTIEKPYMMIMELVPCGSLKHYLRRLRDKRTRMKSERFFFPDSTIGQDPAQPLKYTDVIFEDSDSDSYIIPDDIPINADYPIEQHSKRPTNLKPLTFTRRRQQLSESSQMPSSPMSLASSQFPSSTTTNITVLDTPSPLTNEISYLLHPILDHNELQNFAYQIAKGMQYLESIKITHRDLAARNVLISTDKTLKISDFGLSRTGVYVSSEGARLPLRWMAVEAIEARTCDSKSDVWSFGVVLWEIGTLGAFPYKDIADCQILPSLMAGKRLERPGICTDDLYSIMLRCWRENPEERPFFVDLVDRLDVKKGNIYVDCKEVSPKYVFPPTVVCTNANDRES